MSQPTPDAASASAPPTGSGVSAVSSSASPLLFHTCSESDLVAAHKVSYEAVGDDIRTFKGSNIMIQPWTRPTHQQTKWFTTYFIYDQGSYPYQVEVLGDQSSIRVCPLIHGHADTSRIQLFECSKVFVGESPLNETTKVSGFHGNNYTGNTIIAKLREDEKTVEEDPFPNVRKFRHIYIYVGSTIFKFRTYKPIVEYVSPIGKGGTPQAWARDEHENVYLMESRTVLQSTIDLSLSKRAYPTFTYLDYYMQSSILVSLEKYAGHRLPRMLHFQNIHTFHVGSHAIELVYTPNPEQTYDQLVWMIRNKDALKDADDVVVKIGYLDGTEKKLDKVAYVELIQAFGEKAQIEPLKIVS